MRSNEKDAVCNFIAAHRKAMALELLHWRDKGVLPPSPNLFERAAALAPSDDDAIKSVENLLTWSCVEKVAGHAI